MLYFKLTQFGEFHNKCFKLTTKLDQLFSNRDSRALHINFKKFVLIHLPVMLSYR